MRTKLKLLVATMLLAFLFTAMFSTRSPKRAAVHLSPRSAALPFIENRHYSAPAQELARSQSTESLSRSAISTAHDLPIRLI